MACLPWSLICLIFFQVCTVLDSLELQYRRDDDYCSVSNDGCKTSHVEHVANLISKHQEQKEAFLKACTLARRNAETFLKYCNRSLHYYTYPPEHATRGPENKVKGGETNYPLHKLKRRNFVKLSSLQPNENTFTLGL